MEKFQQSQSVVTRIVDGEAFLISEDAITHLNPFAAAVWLALEDPFTKSDVAALILEAYPALLAKDLHGDIDQTLRTLERKKLVQRS
jgi:hypothetical protein